MRRPSGSGNAGTLIALLGIIAIALGLLALIAMIMPGAFGFLAVLFGIFLFGALHYVLWGWWLAKPPGGDDDEAA